MRALRRPDADLTPDDGTVSMRFTGAGRRRRIYGEVPERLNGPVSKTGWPARVTGVRIPPSPLHDFSSLRQGVAMSDIKCSVFKGLS